jgi:hypothetical protein
MKMNSRLMRGAATLALVAVVAVPFSASAVPGRGTNKAPNTNIPQSENAAQKQSARQANLADRIAGALARRAIVFDAAASRISARIERTATLAATVAAAGGDVTAVLAKLDSARAAIVAAKAAEASAVDMFKAVPTATDRRAAFAAARAQARSARASLGEARSFLRNAIMALKVVVNGLVPVTP